MDARERRSAGAGQARPFPTGPLRRAAAAELVGSFTVVLMGAGSVVVGGSVGAGLVGVALATGAAFAAALTATLPVSGGGVNPVLTAAFWVVGWLSTARAAVYLAAQMLGAILAGALLRFAVPEPTWRAARLGAPLLAQDVGAGRGVLIEAVLSFVLTVIAFATILGNRSRSASHAGLALGLLIAGATLVAWPLTGAALNPARAIGPEVAGGTWEGWWVYWIGPGAGAVTGAVASWFAYLREAPPPEGGPVGRAPHP